MYYFNKINGSFIPGLISHKTHYSEMDKQSKCWLKSREFEKPTFLRLFTTYFLRSEVN